MTSPDSNLRRYFDEHKIPVGVFGAARGCVAERGGIPRVRDSYEDWFGEAGDEKLIEKHFTGYMFNDIVPPWVRHFCKKVLKRDSEGEIDPAEFGVVHKSASRAQINKGLEAAMYIVGFMIILFMFGESAAQVLKLQCLFPPCY